MKKIAVIFLILILNFSIYKNIEYHVSIKDANNDISISIPKISLLKKLYPNDSERNNVDENLYVVPESKFPDKEESILIIAGHNGNSTTSYFKDLDELKLNDEIIINIKGVEYTYKITEIYNIEKTGYFGYDDKETNTLYLITCSNNNLHQVVYKSILIDENVSINQPIFD